MTVPEFRPLFPAPASAPASGTGPTRTGRFACTDSAPPQPAEVESRSADESFRHLRTQFLRRIAHDIASPAGVTTTALEELANGDTQRPELLTMARRGLRRLLRLSEQLALVAELETAPIAPETTVEDLVAVTQSALDQAVAIDGRRGVTASLVSPPGKVMVAIDRRLVTSCLREIVGNALRIAGTTVRVTVQVAGDQAVVRIEDDGNGFTQQSLGAVRQRFTAQSSARGLGLSLSIAAEVLDAHGGDLRFGTSELPPKRPGAPRGAAVDVVFPIK